MPSTRRSKSLMLLFLLAACGGDKAEITGVTSTPMTLTFEPASVTAVGSRTAQGTFQCNADMTILAHGGSDHILSLQGISATFSSPAGAALNTVSATPASWFGVSTLKRNESAVAHRQPTGSGPFLLLTTLTYTDQFGTSKTAAFNFNCIE